MVGAIQWKRYTLWSSSERVKIMDPPSIGLRLNYTRVRAGVSLFHTYGTLARTHIHIHIHIHTHTHNLPSVRLRLNRDWLRELSQLSKCRQWRSYEQQSNDKLQQRVSWRMLQAKHNEAFWEGHDERMPTIDETHLPLYTLDMKFKYIHINEKLTLPSRYNYVEYNLQSVIYRLYRNKRRVSIN